MPAARNDPPLLKKEIRQALSGAFPALGPTNLVIGQDNVSGNRQTTVADLAALRAVVGYSDNDVRETLSAGCDYYFSAVITDPDDGDLVIKPNDKLVTDPGRWTKRPNLEKHNDLSGLDLGDYLHLSAAQKSALLAHLINTLNPHSTSWSQTGAEQELSRVRTIYLGQHGNDANDGQTPATAVIKLSRALTLAIAAGPTPTTPVVIWCDDAGLYTADSQTITNPLGETVPVDDTGPIFEIPSYVFVFAPNAVIYQSRVYLNAASILKVKQIVPDPLGSVITTTPHAGLCVALKAGNTSTIAAYVEAEYLSGYSMVASNWSTSCSLIVRASGVISVQRTSGGDNTIKACIAGDGGYAPAGTVNGVVQVHADEFRLSAQGASARDVSVVRTARSGALVYCRGNRTRAYVQTPSGSHTYRAVWAPSDATVTLSSPSIDLHTDAGGTDGANTCVAEVGGTVPNNATAYIDTMRVVVNHADVETGDGDVIYQVLSNDSRLTDARTPLAHVHAHSGLTGLNTSGHPHNVITYPRTPVADADYNLSVTDSWVSYTSLSAGRTVHLTAAVLALSSELTIYVADETKDAAHGAGTHNITFVADSGTLYGVSAIDRDNGVVRVRWDGTDWFVTPA